MGMKIRNVGGYGIKIRDNVKEKPGYGVDPSRPSENRGIHVEGCEIDTTGAGGIFLAAQDSTISRNLVQHAGVVFSAANGILENGDRNKVIHNEIIDVPYCGINARWGRRSNTTTYVIVCSCFKTGEESRQFSLKIL